jgi:hypothetical protein
MLMNEMAPMLLCWIDMARNCAALESSTRRRKQHLIVHEIDD